MILEACVENFEDAHLAEKNGAHQIELCSRLDLDGLTPNFEMTIALCQTLTIPINVMIRPRAGNFAYSELELKKMADQINKFEVLNIKGFVFGVSHHAKTLNYEAINDLALLCKDKTICIHKAIDACPDIISSFSDLKRKCPKVNFVLSSGGEPTAEQGKEKLKEMSLIGEDQIKVIGAGKITQENLPALHEYLGFEYYHGKKIVGC